MLASVMLAGGAFAQGLGLRTGTPGPATQSGGSEPELRPIGPVLESIANPATAIENQQGAIARGAPARASRPVQAPALRGSVQAPVRSARTPVSVLPLPEPPAPAEPPERRPPEADPYAALGIRVGNILLKPSITTSLGYDSNPQRSSATGVKGSPVLRTEGELEIESDWNVHGLNGRIRGGYSRFFRDPQASRPDGEGNLDLRLDASRNTRILLETRARLDTQRPGSPELNAPVIGRPQIYQYGASAGITHDINRLQLTLRGSVDRTDYEDARLGSGAILSQEDRNQTQYGLRLRAAYELKPGFVPFVQADIDRREFDRTVDFSGYRRSSDGIAAKLGTSFEISRQLTGEVSAGYQERDYEDGRLKNLRGAIGDVAVLWSPTPLTTVTLRGSSELGDTNIAGSSGTKVHRGSLEVAHALRRHLIVTAFGNFSRTDYDVAGLREELTGIGARVDYKLTRTFSVRASFTHERLNSTAQGSDYTANIALVGLRVQF